MSEMVSFFVPGVPVGKGRARFGRTKAGHAIAFTPAKTKSYEALVALAGQQAMKSWAPFSGAVRVDMDARLPIPGSWSNKKRALAAACGQHLHAEPGGLYPTVKPDFDNIEKAIMDGMNGVVFVDDKQVIEVLKRKRYSDTPGVQVIVTHLGGGA